MTVIKIKLCLLSLQLLYLRHKKYIMINNFEFNLCSITFLDYESIVARIMLFVENYNFPFILSKYVILR